MSPLALLALLAVLACRGADPVPTPTPGLPDTDTPVVDTDSGTPSDPDPAPVPRVDAVAPDLIDPDGGSILTLQGEALADAAVTVDGLPAEVLEATPTLLRVRTPAGVAAGEVALDGRPAITVEVWSPEAISGARVFDAAFGVDAPEPADAWSWQRATPELAPGWLWRDGPGLIWTPETGQYWMIAGWNPFDPPDGFGSATTTTDEVWSSPDGVTWTLRLPAGHGEFTRRHTHNTLAFDGRIWMIGGDPFYDGAYHRDVVSSADGLDWTVEVDPTPWSARMLQVAGVHDGRMWVVGGQDGVIGEVSTATFHNDVWSSTDGVTWTQVAADAPPSATRWSGRGLVTKLLSFQGRMWLIGGGRYETPDSPEKVFFAEVWSTLDGVTWTQHATPPWPGRVYTSVEVFDGRMWLLGGYNYATGNLNDVWSTADGETWEQLPPELVPWPMSHADGFAVGPGGLLHAGGNGGVTGDTGVWRMVGHHGGRVDAWTDRAGADVVAADGAQRPIHDPDGLGPGIPGVWFDGLQHHLDRGASELQPTGRSVFWVGSVPWNSTVGSDVDPAETVVGDGVTPFCSAGVEGDRIVYHEGAAGWTTIAAGADLRPDEGEVRLLGFTHAADGRIVGWVDGLPAGEGTASYEPLYEGWRTIGAGYGYATSTRLGGTLGAVVIAPAALSADDVGRLERWAQGRFGAR